MTEFNLLTESFITQSGGKTVTAEEVDTLIRGGGNAFTFSGTFVNFNIDLGAQKSVKHLRYTFSPLSLSGVSVYYGRDLTSLVSGTAVLSGTDLIVEPTISGYTYPRYFSITHTTPTGTPINVTELFVINDEEDLNFGEDGLLTSVTLVGNAVAGISPVQTVYVKNDGVFPTDIYVSADTAFQAEDIFSRLELSATETGTFSAFFDSLSVPDSIPWEWGLFNNTTVEDNKLKLIDPANDFPTFEIGEEVVLVTEDLNTRTNQTHTITALDSLGNHVFCRIKEDHSIVFIDPVRNTRTTSALPGYTVSGIDDEKHHTHMAWDGDDGIYFLNGKSTRQIQKYTISTNTMSVLTTVSGFYNRRSRPLAYHGGKLYIGGTTPTSGSSSTVGSGFWMLNLSNMAETQLANLPDAPNSTGGEVFQVLDDYIYYITGKTDSKFYRYNISTSSWSQLANHPATFPIGLSAHYGNKEIWLLDDSTDTVHSFNTLTTSWTSNQMDPDLTLIACGGLGMDDTMFYYSTSATRVRVLNTPHPRPNLGLAASGTWTSPIFKLDTPENFHRVFVPTNKGVGSYLKSDTSLGVDNLEVRGSNSSPAAANFTEEFEDVLDPAVYVTSSLGDSTIVTSGSTLRLDHQGSTETLNSAIVCFSLPLSTRGEMQYRFRWNPPSDKLVNSTHYSAFYLVPFLDLVADGSEPDRDPVTLRRSENNNIYLRFGQNSDSAGKFTRIQFFNGSTTASFAVTMYSGKFYDILLAINWDSGAYSIRVGGSLIGSGTIPQARIALLRPEGHAFEIFSAGENKDFVEQYQYLTINRVGTEVGVDENVTTPVHYKDPIFGIPGGTFYPITVNSPLLPKTEYVQFRLTLRSDGGSDLPLVDSIKFPQVIKLEGMQPGESAPVYVRYNYPADFSLSTNVINLKAWMVTDKE